MRESLEALDGEASVKGDRGASDFLPPRMLDLTPLTLADLRRSIDPELEKAVEGIKDAAKKGKFGDGQQAQRD
jgi:nitrogen regulatory protein PII